MTEAKPRPVILASGGMDSYLVWRLYASNALNLFVDIEHKYRHKERKALEAIATQDRGFDWLRVHGAPIARYEHPSGIIPFRNAHLVLAAAQYGDDILMGVTKDEINSDKSATFMSAMATVLNESHRAQYWTTGREFTVSSPVRHKTKTQLIKDYLAAGFGLAPLLATVSCYSDSVQHCGACPSCFKRWVAMRLNGIADKQVWLANPAHYAVKEGIVRKAQDGTYSKERGAEVLEAIEGCGL